MAHSRATPYPVRVRFGSLFAIVALGAAMSSVSDATASPPGVGPVPPALLNRGLALSVGAPNAGRLVAGAHLEPSANIRIVPTLANEDYRWGLPALIKLLQRAADRVHQRHPGAVLSVGDMSRRTGGELREHLSHQSGRDVDIAFYAADATGAPLLPSRMVDFDAAGASRELPAARFDDQRNWALVEALVSDPEFRVEHIFVSRFLRGRLLRHAEQQRVPLRIRAKAARLMSEPGSSTPHADHFHVRIACPPSQAGVCETYPRLRARPARRDANRSTRLPARPSRSTAPKR